LKSNVVPCSIVKEYFPAAILTHILILYLYNKYHHIEILESW